MKFHLLPLEKNLDEDNQNNLYTDKCINLCQLKLIGVSYFIKDWPLPPLIRSNIILFDRLHFISELSPTGRRMDISGRTVFPTSLCNVVIA